MTCAHETVRLTRRANVAGRVYAARQCVACGWFCGSAKLAEAGDLARLPVFDEELQERGREAQRFAMHEEFQARRSEEREEWFRQHDDYLRSPQWREKREAVLRRASCRCEARLSGCRSTANEVHHLSYRHWRNEPLFELVAICGACHRAITDMDRQEREGAA